MDIIQKGLSSPVEAILGGSAEIFRFVVSSEAVDRDGDIVLQDGWNLKDFEANPIALLSHDHSKPIGKWSNLQKGYSVNGVKQMTADLTLAPPVSDLLKYAHALISNNILNATSVGFRVLEAEKRKDAKKGLLIKQAALHEISVVSVPANQEAIRIAKSLDISDDVLRSLIVEEGSDSANDLEHDKDSAVLKRAKELLSKKQTPDEKPEVTKRDSNIWTSHINPELLDSINRARKVLK